MRNPTRKRSLPVRALLLALTWALLAVLALPAVPAGAQTVSVAPSGPASGSGTPGAVRSESAVPGRFSTTSVGLVPRASSVAGGGVVVDLLGGFQNVVTATARPGRTVGSRCSVVETSSGASSR